MFRAPPPNPIRFCRIRERFDAFAAPLSPDHSFFGSEWQKRWCVLNNLIFYYFGSEKGLCEMSADRDGS